MIERHIQFCLDISSSMRTGNPPPIDELNSAFTAFQKQCVGLVGRTTIGVVQYHGSASVSLKPQRLPDYKSKLQVPENAYGSNVFAGVELSLQQLDSVKHDDAGTSAKFLVLISDGGASKLVGDENKLELRQSWLNALRDLILLGEKRGINVIVLGVGDMPKDSQKYKNIHTFAGNKEPFLGKDYHALLNRLFIHISRDPLSINDVPEGKSPMNNMPGVNVFNDDVVATPAEESNHAVPTKPFNEPDDPFSNTTGDLR